MRKDDYEQIDAEIEIGHRYAALALALGVQADERAACEIRREMGKLLRQSRYLSHLLETHPNPLSFLASRGHLNGKGNLERNQNLPSLRGKQSRKSSEGGSKTETMLVSEAIHPKAGMYFGI